MSLVAVFIPPESIIARALKTRGAQDAIRKGFKLYSNGKGAALLPAPRPGWVHIAMPLPILDGETAHA
jgi:hypothetical protein